MPFAPIDLSLVENKAAAASVRILEKTEADDLSLPSKWNPLFKEECSFDPPIFERVMENLIKNPNINSSWLFRADILLDRLGGQAADDLSHLESPGLNSSRDSFQSQLPQFQNLQVTRFLVRRMIPRNERRDKPLEQSCVFFSGWIPSGVQRSLIIYLPHVASAAEMPFYHPAVRGIGFLHDWNPQERKGVVSTHYLYFDGDTPNEKITRTAMHLLRVLHKHGEGQVVGYKKRVHHDVLVPQVALQERYAALKQKYARSLVEGWEEVTDPTKHVFEDLCIASFLMELWKEMYKDETFPGFVDIGCGNGLLVHILNQEGFAGWGFDARARKSWSKYSSRVRVRTLDGSHETREALQTLVLLPSVTRTAENAADKALQEDQIHDGRFPERTFIISNHADELTPWTPILARLSKCPFIMIPCCSHNLTGERFRAPPPKDKTASSSTYNSLCAWVAEIAEDCGWVVEKEVLRIPSTRNTAFIGRRLADESKPILDELLRKYGGTRGYYENVAKLLKAANRGH